MMCSLGAGLNDDWLYEDGLWDNHPSNNYFIWFHVFEGEINHRGQIRMIRKMLYQNEWSYSANEAFKFNNIVYYFGYCLLGDLLMLIREIQPLDAEKFICLIKQVESEAKFMLMEAGERKTTPEQQRKQLERIKKQSNSTIFVAEQEEGELVGYLIAIGGSVKRTKHSAYLVVGILEKYRAHGIGTSLFQRLEEWARNSNISRLELTVVTQNEAGISLYNKSGFVIEGIKRKSLLIDDEFYNEYFMSKIF